MRDQYAGDISDLLKFAFLRTLGADDKTIGVGWYYNPRHDGRPDGRHREYCDEQNWASFDLALWNALRRLPEQSVAALEKLPIWPTKTRFHRIPVPPSGSRKAWANNMVSALQGASIVFLDPDNGIGAESERHATVGEIAAVRKPGRTVVLIKFPGRDKTHAEQIEEYHSSLRSGAGALSAVTVRTNVFVKSGELARGVPRARWFTLVDADDQLIKRAEQFAARLNEIDKCSAHVVHGPGIKAMSPEKPRDDSSVPYDANATLPMCDWVYFATTSQADGATTRAVVSELEMIIRPVYDSREPPNAIANVKHIRQGHTILLVYGGKGQPYRPMFSCKVVAPPRPVPNFEAFSFADGSQEDRLKSSGFTPDPHLKRFTGISVRMSANRLTGSIQKPKGNNTIRSWKEVEAYNAGKK